jgi:DNA-binding FrmR family transcriptional regulator
MEMAPAPSSKTSRTLYWDKEDILRRLSRVEGQVRGVRAMIEREESCRDILVQVAAIEGAMRQVSRIVSACSVAEQVLALQSSQVVPSDDVRAALEALLR